MKHSKQVKEDNLVDLNLNALEYPKMVWVSAELEEQFKANLHALVHSYKAVFA